MEIYYNSINNSNNIVLMAVKQRRKETFWYKYYSSNGYSRTKRGLNSFFILKLAFFSKAIKLLQVLDLFL